MKKYSLFIKIVACAAAMLMLLSLVPAVFADEEGATATLESESKYIAPSDGILQDVVKEDTRHKIVTFGDEAISLSGNYATTASGEWGGNSLTAATVDSSTYNPYTGSIANAIKLTQTIGTPAAGSYKWEYKANTAMDISKMNYLVLDMWIDSWQTANEVNGVQFCFELTSSGDPDKNEQAFVDKLSKFTDAKTLVPGWNHVQIPLSRYTSVTGGELDKNAWNYFRIFNNETTGLTANHTYSVMFDNIYFWDGIGSEFVDIPAFNRTFTVGTAPADAWKNFFVSPATATITYDVSELGYMVFDLEVPQVNKPETLQGLTAMFELNSHDKGALDKEEASALLTLSKYSTTGTLEIGTNHIVIPVSALTQATGTETKPRPECDYTRLKTNRLYGFTFSNVTKDVNDPYIVKGSEGNPLPATGYDATYYQANYVAGTYKISNFRFVKSNPTASSHIVNTSYAGSTVNFKTSASGRGSSFSFGPAFNAVDITGMKYILMDLTVPDGVDLTALGNISIMMEITSSGQCDQSEKNNGGKSLKETLISGYTLKTGVQTLVFPIKNWMVGTSNGDTGPFDPTKVNYFRWYNDGAVDAKAAGTYRLENLRFWDGEYDVSLSELFSLSVGDTGALNYTGAPVKATFDSNNAYRLTEDLFTLEWYTRGGERLDAAPSAFGFYQLHLPTGSDTAKVSNYAFATADGYTVTIPEVTFHFAPMDVFFSIHCEHDFTYGCSDTCNTCGYQRIASHSFSTQATPVDGTFHEYACIHDCGTVKEVIDRSAGKEDKYTKFVHRWDDGVLQENGMILYTCVECGYQDTVKMHDPSEHTVSFYDKTWGRQSGNNSVGITGDWLNYTFGIPDESTGGKKTFDLRGMQYMVIEFWVDSEAATVLSNPDKKLNFELSSYGSPDYEENQGLFCLGNYCVSNAGKLQAGWNLIRIPLNAIPQHSEANRANMAAVNHLRFFNNWKANTEEEILSGGLKANVKIGNIWFWDGKYDDGVVEEVFRFRVDTSVDVHAPGSFDERRYIQSPASLSSSWGWGRFADKDAEIIYKYTLTGDPKLLNSLVWSGLFNGNDLNLDASFDGETYFDVFEKTGTLSGLVVSADILEGATAAGVTPTTTLYVRIKDATTDGGNGPVLRSTYDVTLVAKYDAHPQMEATLNPVVDYITENTATVNSGLTLTVPEGTRSRVTWMNAAGEEISAPYASNPYDIGTYTVRVLVMDPVYYADLSETVTISENGYLNATVKALNVSVDGVIGFKYYLSLPTVIKNNLSDYNITFVGADDTVYATINAANGEYITAGTAQGTYMFTCPLAAAEMTKEISVQIVRADGTAQGNRSTAYSVKYYAEEMYKRETDANTKKLLWSLLQYGAAAQEYFNESTDNLANNSTVIVKDAYTASTAIDALGAVQDYKNKQVGEYDVVGIKARSYKLYLQSETMMAVTFTVKDAGDTFTFTCGEDTLPYEIKDGKYVVYLPNISAPNMKTSYTIVATNGTNGETYQFTTSVLSYVRTALGRELTQAESNLYAALYDYYAAANAKFTASN